MSLYIARPMASRVSHAASSTYYTRSDDTGKNGVSRRRKRHPWRITCGSATQRLGGSSVEGHTTVNQAMLTGESKPIEKAEGDEVTGGAVNGESSFTMKVQKTGDETYLSQVVSTVRKAQEARSRTQDLADRAALWLTVIAVSAGMVTLVSWLMAGRELEFSLERMVTVMLITCPHALGLAIPLVVAVSTALAARRGLLIRDRSSFERARLIDAVVFDKTGTLTEGRFGVTDVVCFGDMPEDQVLRLAASVESHSEHPIAQGVVEAAQARNLEYPRPSDFQSLPGEGARAQVEGRAVRTVSPTYLEENNISVDNEEPARLAGQGKTVV